MMRPSVERLCDELDAVFFTGDQFIDDAEARERMRAYLQRWERALNERNNGEQFT